MSDDLVSDDLWERIAPLLPRRPPRRHRYPGRLPADDRAALRGIVYVLRKAGLLDMDGCAIDGSHVRALKEGLTPDPRRPTRGITPKTARRGVPHGSGPGETRRVVERTFARLHRFERLRIRYETRADLHLGLLRLACGIICLRRLRTSF
ncbi:transposase [Streptomyces litmocidini]|uniref:transposase n=1 Tax=Streptomyces litmocidini TaxID=67318 RepID=UPI0037031766